MAAGDLTTLANVKAWLGLTTAADDALLSRLITGVSQYMQAWLNRIIPAQGYTETRNGNGKSFMAFADYPVTAIAGLSINGNEVKPSPDIFTPGYYFDDRALYLRGLVFFRGLGNIQVAYTAGYETTPPEIEQACIETVALRYKERDRIGHASKSVQGETISYTVTDFPASVRTILNNYKKVIPL